MKKLLSILLFLCAQFTIPQSIGGFIGGGLINANSPNVTSAAGSIFIESGELFNWKASVRASFIYAVDIEQILPSSTNRYSPFLKGITLKAIASQPASRILYIEQGVGLMALNDRMYSDVNEIDFGFVISVGAGLDLRNNKPEGFRIGLGTDYAFTFTNTYAKYFALFLHSQYYF